VRTCSQEGLCSVELELPVVARYASQEKEDIFHLSTIKRRVYEKKRRLKGNT
jgi:hypothetical protein